MDSSSTKILGFIAGAHSCGLAYIENDKLIAVLEEERFTREKPYVDYENDFDRFPTECVMQLIDGDGYNVDFQYIDYFTSFFKYETARTILFDIIGFELPKEKYIKIDHHEAHATLSYLISGFNEDTLIFCADASGGDNKCHCKTYVGLGGNMYLKEVIPTRRKSFGHLYAALTEMVGFKRLKDEGKVVGLSGHGRYWQEIYEVFDKSFKIEGTKTDLDNHPIEAGGLYRDLFSNFYEYVGSKNWKTKHALPDIAFTGQLFFEDKVIEMLNNLHKKYPYRKLALSGGIFANVKLNKRINELDWVDEMFVLPPMGDEGLAYGCAMAVYKKLNPSLKPFRMPNMYLGKEYTEAQVLKAGYGFKIEAANANIIAGLLMNKKIIGLYQGRSEHGARALGNRSIICDATDPNTYDILNGKLGRNDFMPFAPAVLDEDADVIFNVHKSRYTAEFMTCCFDTREEYRDKIPTVVHPIDKTARIQIVTRDSNPFFYAILKEYKKLTGLGVLVNTSFNIHNEPIVETPENAFNHLANGIIDYLVTPFGCFSKFQ